MKLEQFAIWKFKEYEGRLEGFDAGNLFVTKFSRGYENFEIHYDVKTNMCDIINMSRSDRQTIRCPFKMLTEKLKEMGVYKERTENRHSSSISHYEGNLEDI